MLYPRDARAYGINLPADVIVTSLLSVVLLWAAPYAVPYIIPTVLYMFYPFTATVRYVVLAYKAFPSERQIAVASDCLFLLAVSECCCGLAVSVPYRIWGGKSFVLQTPVRTMVFVMLFNLVAAVALWLVNLPHRQPDWETWCWCVVFMVFAWIAGTGANYMRIERFYEDCLKQRVKARQLRLKVLTEDLATAADAPTQQAPATQAVDAPARPQPHKKQTRQLSRPPLRKQ